MRKTRLLFLFPFLVLYFLFFFFSVSTYASEYELSIKGRIGYIDSVFLEQEFEGIFLRDSAVKWRIEDFESVGDYGYRISAEPFFNLSSSDISGNGALDFTYRKVQGKNTFYTDVSSKLDYSLPGDKGDNMLPLENTNSFSAGLFGRGGFSGSMARFTYNRYINKQFFGAPNFLFAEPQLKFHYSSNPTGFEEKRTVSEGAVAVGYGVGRIYPTAIYDRAVRFFETLYQNGLLKRKPTMNELKRLMSVLPNRWTADFDTFKALNELRLMGLLESEVSFSLAERLRDEIVASRDYIEYGQEIRAGFEARVFGVNLPYISLEENSKKDIPIRFFIEYRRIFNFGRLVLNTGAAFYLQFQQFDLRLNSNTGATYIFSDKLRAFASHYLNLNIIGGNTNFSTGVTSGVSYIIVGNYLSASFNTSLDFVRAGGTSFGLSLRFLVDAY